MPFPFFKTKILPSQKTPDPHKNFFQNYGDHFHYLKHDAVGIYEKYGKSDRKLSLLTQEILARLTMFDALRDGYDYFDEVVGVTVIPFLSSAAAMCLGALALWEGAHALAIKAGMLTNDGGDHVSNAMAYLLAATTAYVISAVSYFKSMISLVTRPLVTACQGFQPQDKERFYDEDTAARNEKVISALSMSR